MFSKNLVLLVQDVPVGTLDPTQALQLKAPAIPSHQVHLVLPPLGTLRKYIEKINLFSNSVQISANMQGELELSAVSSEVKINTLFLELTNPALISESIGSAIFEPLNDPKAHAKVIVPTATLMKLFHFHNANVKNVVCCIVQSECLLFYAYLSENESDDAVFLHYVPAKAVK